MSKICSNKLCVVPVEEQIFGIRGSGIRKGKPRSECKACEKIRSAVANKLYPERSTRLRRDYADRQSNIHDAAYYSAIDLTKEKRCIGLRCEKPLKTLLDFYRNKGTKDGFAAVCKECKWQRDLDLKRKFVDGYGGKCTCCGENEIRFLTLEHINHDGKEHRKNSGGNTGMWLEIIKQGFPPQYTVLCFNCNCSEGQGKPCPHKSRKGA